MFVGELGIAKAAAALVEHLRMSPADVCKVPEGIAAELLARFGGQDMQSESPKRSGHKKRQVEQPLLGPDGADSSKLFDVTAAAVELVQEVRTGLDAGAISCKMRPIAGPSGIQVKYKCGPKIASAIQQRARARLSMSGVHNRSGQGGQGGAPQYFHARADRLIQYLDLHSGRAPQSVALSRRLSRSCGPQLDVLPAKPPRRRWRKSKLRRVERRSLGGSQGSAGTRCSLVGTAAQQRGSLSGRRSIAGRVASKRRSIASSSDKTIMRTDGVACAVAAIAAMPALIQIKRELDVCSAVKAEVNDTPRPETCEPVDPHCYTRLSQCGVKKEEQLPPPSNKRMLYVPLASEDQKVLASFPKHVFGIKAEVEEQLPPPSNKRCSVLDAPAPEAKVRKLTLAGPLSHAAIAAWYLEAIGAAARDSAKADIGTCRSRASLLGHAHLPGWSARLASLLGHHPLAAAPLAASSRGILRALLGDAAQLAAELRPAIRSLAEVGNWGVAEEDALTAAQVPAGLLTALAPLGRPSAALAKAGAIIEVQGARVQRVQCLLAGLVARADGLSDALVRGNVLS